MARKTVKRPFDSFSVFGTSERGSQSMRWGAMRLRNSVELMILVFFQNFGKWRWLPVTR
jgi:hypothetical protein